MKISTSMVLTSAGVKELFKHSFSDAICGHDVDAVSTGLGVKEFPDDFFVGGDFEDFDLLRIFLSVAADDGVAIGESLAAAGIGEAAADILISGAPSDLSFGVKFDGLIAIGEID